MQDARSKKSDIGDATPRSAFCCPAALPNPFHLFRESVDSDSYVFVGAKHRT